MEIAKKGDQLSPPDNPSDPTSDPTETVLTAGCYCKAVRFSITVPTSCLPLPVHLCSCSICRTTHGTLSTFHAPLPKGVSPVFTPPSTLEGSLTGYTHKNSPNSERFFCRTCGCHVGDVDLEPGPDADGHLEWRVASSVFDDHGPDRFRIGSHVFADASAQGTGGMLGWLPKMGGREMKVWNPAPGSAEAAIFPPGDPSRRRPGREFDAEGNERLRAECHCGGVSFTIPRPTVPAVAGDPSLRRWASPLDRTKWVATLDFCDDCRLMDGAHVIPWTFVPRALLLPRVPADLAFGTLTSFDSSPGVRRAFCGVCGATVFYSCARRTPSEEGQIVDVAVGILRAPEGVAAEDWLTWRTGRMSFLESGMRYDPVFAESLRKGYEDWGMRMYGRSPDFKLGPPSP